MSVNEPEGRRLLFPVPQGWLVVVMVRVRPSRVRVMLFRDHLKRMTAGCKGRERLEIEGCALTALKQKQTLSTLDLIS